MFLFNVEQTFIETGFAEEKKWFDLEQNQIFRSIFLLILLEANDSSGKLANDFVADTNVVEGGVDDRRFRT